MKDETIIKIKNVSFKYHNQTVLDDINLEIKRGAFLGIIGPNGSGKTTLLKIILGLLKPKTGLIKLFGHELQYFTDWEKIGYVPQKAGSQVNQFPITVEEVVGLGRVKPGMFTIDPKGQEAIDAAMEAVEITDLRDQLLNELSGGQQQRVYIARALASSPELLILDEPTVGVDSESQTKFYQLLKKLNREFKLTLVLISHDIDVVAHEVSEIACLNSKLICHGPPKQILKSGFVDNLYSKELKFVIHGH